MTLRRELSLTLGTALAAGIGVYAFRSYFGGGTCHSKKRLEGKTVIVTGGNSGIGKQTAKDLAQRGARVVLACRDLERAETAAEEIRKETGNLDVLVRKLDLASLKSVENFAANFLKTETELHILVNNAGICACPAWKSEDGYEIQLAVNHLGHFLLTNLLLECLKQSAPSRIINVASIAHESGDIQFDDIHFEKNYTPFGAYCQSKLANVLFTKSLHKRLQGSRVTTYAVHPGIVDTDLARYAPMVFAWWKIALWKPLMWTIFKNSHQGAQTSVYCSVQDGIEEHSGKYFSDCKVKAPSEKAMDEDVAEQLWDVSLKMTHLDNDVSFH